MKKTQRVIVVKDLINRSNRDVLPLEQPLLMAGYVVYSRKYVDARRSS